jgi:hypothetical protein
MGVPLTKWRCTQNEPIHPRSRRNTHHFFHHHYHHLRVFIPIRLRIPQLLRSSPFCSVVVHILNGGEQTGLKLSWHTAYRRRIAETGLWHGTEVRNCEISGEDLISHDGVQRCEDKDPHIPDGIMVKWQSNNDLNNVKAAGRVIIRKALHWQTEENHETLGRTACNRTEIWRRVLQNTKQEC